MKVFLAITIDTEIDRSPNWKVAEDESFSSVLDGIPQRLTPLFDKFGAKPTYLLSSEVMENNGCIDVLKNLQHGELGTHLHGDLIEPERKIYTMSKTLTAAMQNSYPKEIEYQKLENLTNLFIEKFGYRPTSFRAGRFAAGINTINSLESLGYLVDSSVTPGIDWNLFEGRANFLDAPDQPYFPSKENLLTVGESPVLQIPVSIIKSKFRKYFYLIKKIKQPKLLHRIAAKVFPVYWLRPSFQSSQEMLYVIKKMIQQHPDKESIVLNMMFHSMEVMPSKSPYNKTEKDCEEFLRKIEDVLHYCKKNNYTFATLSELYPYFKK